MRDLIEEAIAARLKAHAPYSNFLVGAAVLDEHGRIHAGCNIENASYGLTMCAERVAIFKAVSEGIREFTRIAVVTETDRLTPPCGACRQIIWEFCGDIPVIMSNVKGESREFRMSELLPEAFDGGNLKGK